jgi:YaiO family outer membrane protein
MRHEGATVTVVRIGLAALLVLGTLSAPASAQTDPVAEARRLAVAGQRPAAIRLLDARLTAVATDTDARTLRGLIHAWDGRYAEARADLAMVLAAMPTHYDALTALARVELWDGHPDRSEALTVRGLQAYSQRADLMEIRALALEQLGRYGEARDQIDAALRLDRSRDTARRIRRRLVERLPAWFAALTYRADRFDDGRAGWSEGQASLSRQAGFGTIGVRAYGAARFGVKDYQIELEAYPRLAAGTYMYLAGAYAPDARLYPRRRGAVDLYQSLGRGWEATAGVRRMEFTSTVQIYTGAVSKYTGNWLLTARAWVNPDRDRDSVTLNFGARHYAGDGESYWGVSYARGTYRDDVRQVDEITRLFSNAATLELQRRIGRTYWGGSASLSREERGPGDAFLQATFSLTGRVRF